MLEAMRIVGEPEVITIPREDETSVPPSGPAPVEQPEREAEPAGR
jgi:hypothetical protein